jgi:hypothetical protein
MQLRKLARGNLVLMAGARVLAGNVSGNLGLAAFGVRRDSVHNPFLRGGHTVTR